MNKPNGIFGGLGLHPPVGKKVLSTQTLKPKLANRSHFKDENKGFEGITLFKTNNGKEYLLALCEGNKCKKTDDDDGEGRIIAFKRSGDGTKWVFDHRIKIGRKVLFRDFSGMDIHNGRIAIVSQESSAMLVGKIGGNNGELKITEKKIYSFPGKKAYAQCGSNAEDKSGHLYWNVEGVSWVDDEDGKVVIVSDRCKDDDNPVCRRDGKGQSIHTFKIP